MKNSINMPIQHSQSIDFPFKDRNPFTDNLSEIRKELRQRRKNFLGSYISIKPFIETNGTYDEEKAEHFYQYLANRTAYLWEKQDVESLTFCLRFYKIATACLRFADISNECVDDVIQLAECLVRSRRVFVIAGKDMLPFEMISELFDFTESYDESFFLASFEDAVLGAIAILLGALTDPISDGSEV